MVVRLLTCAALLVASCGGLLDRTFSFSDREHVARNRLQGSQIQQFKDEIAGNEPNITITSGQRIVNLPTPGNTSNLPTSRKSLSQLNDVEQDESPDLKEELSRIYYGQDASEGQFPFMARLKVLKKWSNGVPYSYGMCGGSVISERLILTAAHCVVSVENGVVELEKPQNMQVILGDHRLNTLDQEEQVYDVETLIVHEDYDTTTIQHDIALVLLSNNIVFGEGVGLIKVSDSEELLAAGGRVTVAGFGVTESGSISPTLQTMNYTVSSQIACARYWSRRYVEVAEGMVCTDRMLLGDGNYGHIWSGDSGSALFVDHGNGSVSQVALVSWSLSDTGIPSYDVHTNVVHYSGWVLSRAAQLGSVYELELEAGADQQELTIADFRRLLYRKTKIFTSLDSRVVKASVTLSNLLSSSQFVLVYDGDDLLAMLTDDNTLEAVYSTSSRGLTIVVQSGGTTNPDTSVVVNYQAVSSGGPGPTLTCPPTHWLCRDGLYCVNNVHVCDGVGSGFGECRDGSDEDEGCDGEEEGPDQEGWYQVYPGRSTFQWDMYERSIAIQTKSEKGSRDEVSLKLGSSLSETWVKVRFNKFKMYVRFEGCTYYWYGMDYPALPFLEDGFSIYVINFNEDYMSIMGNNQVLWNLEYEGGLSMETCLKTVNNLSGFGKFEIGAVNSYKYKIIESSTNDKLDQDADSGTIEDYSDYDTVEFRDIPHDQWLEWDVAPHPIQFQSPGHPPPRTGIALELFEDNTDTEFSWVEIYFLDKVPYYYVHGCTESVFFFELPASSGPDDLRIWTFEITKTEVTLRCNGQEFGRVTAGALGIKTSCSRILSTSVDRSILRAKYNLLPTKMRVLCEGCLKVDPWRTVQTNLVDFRWDREIKSLELHTSYKKGDEIYNLIGFYEDEDSFDEYKPIYVYHGTSKLWTFVRECLDSWISMDYPSNWNTSQQIKYIFTFHEDYMSFVGNGEILWNLDYNSSIVNKTCKEHVRSFGEYSFLYYFEDEVPDNETFTLREKLRNDRAPAPLPDYKEYTQFTENQFELLSSGDNISYPFNSFTLQLKTQSPLHPSTYFTLGLYSTNNTYMEELTISFLSLAASFYLPSCHESDIIFEKPVTTENIWSVEPTDDSVVLRVNGLRFGSIDRLEDNCGILFGESIGKVRLESEMDVYYRVLCEDCEQSKKEENGYTISIYRPIYQTNIGMVLMATNNSSSYSTICKLGVGRNEVLAICRSMGYKTGTLLDVGLVQEFEKISQTKQFGLSEMRCEPGQPLETCTYTRYTSSPAPCFRAEELAVTCSEVPFTLSVEWFTAKINHRHDTGKFKCAATSTRFGFEINLQDKGEVVILNRHGEGNFTVVSDEMKYKSKKGYWYTKEVLNSQYTHDLKSECYVCVVMLQELNKYDVGLSEDCENDKTLILDEISYLIQENPNYFDD